MVNTKYIYTRNFFYKLAQERFLIKMKEIKDKAEVSILSISNTNPSVISSINNGKINKNNKSFIPDKVAEQIQENLKISARSEGEQDKYAYQTEKEIFWGTEEELNNMGLELFYCIAKDMLGMFCITDKMSCSYTILIQNVLKRYIEYSEVLSLINIESLYRILKIEEHIKEIEIKGESGSEIMDFIETTETPYSDTKEWKENNLKIPKKLYRFGYYNEEYGNPVFYDGEYGVGLFPKKKLSDIMEIEDKAIIYFYEKFIKKKGIAKLFFKSLKEFGVIKRVTKNGKRVPDYSTRPTFEVIEKVITKFIESEVIPLLRENKASSRNLGFMIHDMLFYQYTSILNLVALQEDGQIFEETGRLVDSYLDKVDIVTKEIEKVPMKLKEVAEKREYEFKRAILYENLMYVERVKKQYASYSNSNKIEEIYKNRLINYKDRQFSIMNPKDFVKYKLKNELVGLEFRMKLGGEKYLLVGDIYNIY